VSSEGERVLVVDDEPFIRDLLSAALRFEGFDVEVAGSGREALQLAQPGRYDLVMLDVMMPDLEGTEVCRRLRESGVAVPVVFLTARDSTEDKVLGLGMADDYVTKPFNLEELVARVRAVLRRVGHDSPEDSEMRYSDLVMNVETHEVWRAGRSIDLTATEFRLLQYLLEHPRRVVPKLEILDHVWDYSFDGDPNIVETYISYLRKKLDESGPSLIHTVRGVGYSLRLPKG